jgi:preprotein translocase subunit SecD
MVRNKEGDPMKKKQAGNRGEDPVKEEQASKGGDQAKKEQVSYKGGASKKERIVSLLKDWRIALLIVLLVFSLVSIYPHVENGNLTTNLKFGLDLQTGTWLQMEFKAEVVGFQTDRPVNDFIADLKQHLDADIELVNDNHLEIRAPYTQAELEPIFTAAGGKLVSYEPGVSKDTADMVKRILENKINSLGTQSATINPLTGLNGVSHYIRVELSGVSLAQAKDIVGKQGKFEIRIQTAPNQTEHVLYGDSITTVNIPSQNPPGSGKWGVSFTLNQDGADAFRQAAISSGAVNNPEEHHLQMILDNQVVYDAPLSPDLANELQTKPVTQLYASTGAGSSGLQEASNLEIHLRAGALPVDVSVAGAGYTPASMGDYFKTMAFVTFLVAILAVGVVIYYRYREPAIVLPMMGTNLAEVIILIGIASWIVQFDLATLAGIIAVLGTGIDQLVVITDEILHEGKVPSKGLYMKRYQRAIGIIVVAAATVIIAMLPLALMDLGTLRGFAIVTILGVLIGVIVTRPAYGRIIMEILSK